jgi:hypothetical protein
MLFLPSSKHGLRGLGVAEKKTVGRAVVLGIILENKWGLKCVRDLVSGLKPGHYPEKKSFVRPLRCCGRGNS